MSDNWFNDYLPSFFLAGAGESAFGATTGEGFSCTTEVSAAFSTGAGAFTTGAGADTTGAGADTTGAGADTTGIGADSTGSGAFTTVTGATSTGLATCTVIGSSIGCGVRDRLRSRCSLTSIGGDSMVSWIFFKILSNESWPERDQQLN